MMYLLKYKMMGGFDVTGNISTCEKNSFIPSLESRLSQLIKINTTIHHKTHLKFVHNHFKIIGSRMR